MNKNQEEQISNVPNAEIIKLRFYEFIYYLHGDSTLNQEFQGHLPGSITTACDS